MGLMGTEGNSTWGGLLNRGGAPQTEAPRLPRSLTRVVHVMAAYWLPSILCILNLELLWRGGLVRLSTAAAKLLRVALFLSKWLSLLALTGWGLERGRENIAKRIPTALLCTPVPFAPAAIVPLPEGGAARYLCVGGGDGEEEGGALLLQDDPETGFSLSLLCEVSGGEARAAVVAEGGLAVHCGAEVRFVEEVAGRVSPRKRRIPGLRDVAGLNRGGVKEGEELGSKEAGLAVSPSGELLAASFGTSVSVWALVPGADSEGAEARWGAPRWSSTAGPHAGPVLAAAFLGEKTVISLDKEALVARDAASGLLLASISPSEVGDLPAGWRFRFSSLAVTGEREVAVGLEAGAEEGDAEEKEDNEAVAGAGGIVALLTLPGGKAARGWAPVRVGKVMSSGVSALAASGKLLAAGSRSGHVALVALDRLAVQRIARPHVLPVTSLAILPSRDVVSVAMDNVAARVLFSRSVLSLDLSMLKLPAGPSARIVSRLSQALSFATAGVDLLLDFGGRRIASLARSFARRRSAAVVVESSGEEEEEGEEAPVLEATSESAPGEIIDSELLD